MSLTSQQYAGLASDAYNARPVTKANDEPIEIEGIEYQVLAYASDRMTGYQGTIYRHVDTGSLVVAHRGTEGDKGAMELVQDAGLTDGPMALSRANRQANNAIALTNRALALASAAGARTGHIPEVTVTGHSLGGCLAQITAHHFGLRGETFNAYGAASLDRRIPEGGHSVINHVTALDPVSAASPHFGEVRIYARPEEILALRRTGYENDSSVLDARSFKEAARRGIGSHSMHHFLDVDGAGHPDRSVLGDPAALELAERYAPMIGKFRDDVGYSRAALTLGSRSVSGHIRDLVDEMRGPLQPGEPFLREGLQPDAKRPYLRLPAAQTPHALPLVPGSPVQPRPHTPEADPVGYLDRLIAAGRNEQSDVFRQMTAELANLEPGREQRAQAIAAIDAREADVAREAAAQQVQQTQHQERASHRHVMSH